MINALRAVLRQFPKVPLMRSISVLNELADFRVQSCCAEALSFS